MIAFHGQADVGRRRSLTDDAIVAREPLFIVRGGTGGPKAGAAAAPLALDVIAGGGEHSAEDPEIAWPYGRALVAEANAQGGRDNISAILVRYTA